MVAGWGVLIEDSVVIDASLTTKMTSKTTKIPLPDYAEWAGWVILEWATISTLVLVITVRPCTIYALTEWVCTDWVFCTEHFGMKTDAKIFENDDILGRRHGLGGWGDRLDFRTKKTNG